MAWWKLWRKSETDATEPTSQEVLVHLKLKAGAFGSREEREAIQRMSDRLDEAIRTSGTGAFDGDEFGAGECTLFAYGPDADRLLAVMLPLLQGWPPAAQGYAVKRYGPPGAPTETVHFT